MPQCGGCCSADVSVLFLRLVRRRTYRLINGKLHVGWGSWNGFRSYVEQELKAANELLATGTKLGDVHALRARAAIQDDAAFDAYKADVIEPLVKAKHTSTARRGD